MAGTVQFNWGQADGLKTGGGSAWAYDVMAGPGFVFQSTNCWGKLIFSEKGHLATELVEAGVPPEKPLPLNSSMICPRTVRLRSSSSIKTSRYAAFWWRKATVGPVLTSVVGRYGDQGEP